MPDPLAKARWDLDDIHAKYAEAARKGPGALRRQVSGSQSRRADAATLRAADPKRKRKQAPKPKPKPKRAKKVDLAVGLLKRELADGPKPFTDLAAAAEREGFKDGTLYAARRRLGVTTHRRAVSGGGSTAEWSLPTE